MPTIEKAGSESQSRRRVPLGQLWRDSKAFRVIALLSMLAVISVIVIALFSPPLKYQLAEPPAFQITSEAYVDQLEALTTSHASRRNRVEHISNGENFYPAMLEAMRGAQHSIHLEAYIFDKGEVTDRMIDVVTERARAGVKVRLVLDAVGSMHTPRDYFDAFRQAGGRVELYHPLKWNTWIRTNNRTHRELVVIDGNTAFVGGAGVADHWYKPVEDSPRWRDSMFRIQGDAVRWIQGTFVENWLEASGELLSGDNYFVQQDGTGSATALVVNSSPSQGGSTHARILFQTLLASATKSIDITTPYFLPDESLRNELIRAVKERKARVRVLVPGDGIDHKLTRATSRQMYGDLLEAGVEVFEYSPSMIHAKILVVDDVWAIFGSTNFDNRSFGINDEINVAALDPHLAAALTSQFEQDLRQSHAITLENWRRRPLTERGLEWLGWLLERQQ